MTLQTQGTREVQKLEANNMVSVYSNQYSYKTTIMLAAR